MTENPKKKKNLGGRPPKPIDNQQLMDLMRLYPSNEDAAFFFKVHRHTLDKHIKKYFKMTFPEFRAMYSAHTRFQLRKVIISEALKGKPAALIFCMKNLCGWGDDGGSNDPTDDGAIKWVYEDSLPPK